jgi:hypothetical protein
MQNIKSGGEKMNKKVGIFAVLLVAATLALPISFASATKPQTKILTGTYVTPFDPTKVTIIPAGDSGNAAWKFRDAPVIWLGDIAGSGVYNGNWLTKGGPLAYGGEIVLTTGTYVLTDVIIDGIGNGDLTLGQNGGHLFVKSGSGDLSSIRGTGTITGGGPYAYELEIQINP